MNSDGIPSCSTWDNLFDMSRTLTADDVPLIENYINLSEILKNDEDHQAVSYVDFFNLLSSQSLHKVEDVKDNTEKSKDGKSEKPSQSSKRKNTEFGGLKEKKRKNTERDNVPLIENDINLSEILKNDEDHQAVSFVDFFNLLSSQSLHKVEDVKDNTEKSKDGKSEKPSQSSKRKNTEFGGLKEKKRKNTERLSQPSMDQWEQIDEDLMVKELDTIENSLKIDKTKKNMQLNKKTNEEMNRLKAILKRIRNNVNKINVDDCGESKKFIKWLKLWMKNFDDAK